MKKIVYQTPEVKIKALFIEPLMQGSGNGYTGSGAADIGSGGDDTGGTMDPEAKFYTTHSVWDD